MATYALVRQHSAIVDQKAQCPICREAVGASGEESRGDDVQMGCGCGLHYSCLVRYLHSKLGDRDGLSLSGVCCPSGAKCASFASASVYFITLADLDSLVDYGASGAAAAVVLDSDVPPLTHAKVAELRAWLEESAALEGLRAWLGDVHITDDERQQLVGVRIGEPAFDALVRRGAAGAPEDQPELTAELAAALRALLRPLREGYTDELDPFVAATTKACPTCSLRCTHWHGHQCHHISPTTRGCPGCHVNFCFRCLATEVDNQRERGGRSNCMCGYWSNFCRAITSEQDVADFVAYKDGIPFDSRCGCAVCSECRFEQPCPSCPGDCGVCRGVLNAAPGQANPPSAWVALRSLLPTGSPKARMWEACRRGNAGSLALTLAGAGAAALVNGQDRMGRTCLYNVCDGGHAACLALLLDVPGINVNQVDDNGDSALIFCSHQAHAVCVRLLLAHPRIAANGLNRQGNSALMISSLKDYLESNSSMHTQSECTSLLLGHRGIKVAHAQQGKLWKACLQGDATAVRAVVEQAGADMEALLNCRDRQGRMCLISACEGGHAECVMLLLLGAQGIERGADYSLNTGGALVFCSILGHSECVRQILALPDINVNHIDGTDGRSALLWSSHEGHTECLRLLLADPGINVNHTDSVGDSALILGSRRGHTECVRLLLGAQGINVNHIDRQGNSALMRSGREGYNEWVRLLISGRRQGHTECVRLLMAHPGIKSQGIPALRLGKTSQTRAPPSIDPEVVAAKSFPPMRRYLLLLLLIFVALLVLALLAVALVMLVIINWARARSEQ